MTDTVSQNAPARPVDPPVPLADRQAMAHEPELMAHELMHAIFAADAGVPLIVIDAKDADHAVARRVDPAVLLAGEDLEDVNPAGILELIAGMCGHLRMDERFQADDGSVLTQGAGLVFSVAKMLSVADQDFADMRSIKTSEAEVKAAVRRAWITAAALVRSGSMQSFTRHVARTGIPIALNGEILNELMAPIHAVAAPLAGEDEIFADPVQVTAFLQMIDGIPAVDLTAAIIDTSSAA